ncbi:MAG: O-antigen ligase family protein, partial [Actinobacteria bacterium]|nr:O-antigen ligase family protein [Actinomycetota bacterium]
VFLYVYEHDEHEISGERIAGALTALWVATVAGGFLGLLLPGRSFATPFELLLPGGLTNNPFVRQLVHPQLSSVQVFLGYPVPRPQAPFPYANHWGSVYAVLVPVVLGYLSTRGGRRWRGPLAFVAVASIVPLAFSLNRTAWISLAVGLVYAGFFVMPDRRAQAARAGLVAVAVLATVLLLTPIGSLVTDRVNNGHSDEGRANLYHQSIALALDSPLVGFGAPLDKADGTSPPPIGTQGHLWLVLVSQGIPGLVLFMGWIVILFRSTRRATGTLARWYHVPLLIFLVQLPFYDMLPFQLCIVFATSALALRTVGARAATVPAATAVPA